jgi:hypothetical protein
MLREELHRLPRPCLRGTSGRPGLRHQRLRPEHRIPVLEEGVRVRHAVVGVGVHAQDRLSAADVLQLETEPVGLEITARCDELLGVVLVLAALPRAARQPPSVGTPRIAQWAISLEGARPGPTP